MVTGASSFDMFLQYAAFVLQLLYFFSMIVLAVVAVLAVRLYKRHVDFITGRTEKAEAKKVSVEEFVD